MISELIVRERIADYLVGQLDLDSFEDWIAQNTWNVHQWGTEALQELAYTVEAKLAESSTEDSLRRELMPLVQEYRFDWSTVAGPRVTTSKSSHLTNGLRVKT